MSKIIGKVGKKVTGIINLQISAGKATPSPPVGPALGQKGVSNIMDFCKSFNEATKSYELGMPIRTRITAYGDKSCSFELLGCPISYLIKKEIGLEKGSTAPGRILAKTMTEQQVRNVAEAKMKQGLSARSVEAAMKIVAGSARSMGIKIVGDVNNG